MGLLDRFRPKPEERSNLPLSFDTWMSYLGQIYPLGMNQTLQGKQESIPSSFQGLATGAMGANGVVYACMQARMMLLSEVRFQFQGVRNGRPGDLYGTQELKPLENPWPTATTGDLIARADQDVSLGGNFFGVRLDSRIKRLRPDWVTLVLTGENGDPDTEVLGIAYQPGGPGSGRDPITFLREQIMHFAPMPDPLASYRGMSWLTPIIREIQADSSATVHKDSSFSNGATPNMIVKLDVNNMEKFEAIKQKFRENHEGAANAYKCLHPDTEVAMWDGRRLRAADVVAGDAVVAWESGHAVEGLVSAAEWQPPSPIVTVTTQRGREIKTNDKHPFLLADGRWVEAADLTVGDRLVPGLGWGSDDRPDALTAYEAWVLGALVGDGCMVSSTPVVSAWDEGVRTRIGIGYDLVHTGKGHDYRVKGITNLLHRSGLMGKRSWEKRIPTEVMTGSAKVQASFLSGLIDADGHVSDPGLRHSAEVSITSTSWDLLADARHLFAALGVNVSLSSPPAMAPKLGYGLARHQGHRLAAFGNDQAALLQDVVTLACGIKAERLATYATRPSLRNRSRYERVVAVEVGPAEPTIGIEVAGHHTHVTGGMVTHNTLFLAAGADATVVGQNFQQMDFKALQGSAETRIAAASGVHPVVVALSEGLQGSSLNAGNFAAAARLVGDKFLRPWWRGFAGSAENVIRVPSGSRLWFDTRDIAFLQADITDRANVQQIEAQTIKALIDSGYEPESIVKAVLAQDWSLLVHTHLFSVQLQPPMPEGVPALPDPGTQMQLAFAPMAELMQRSVLAQENRKPDVFYIPVQVEAPDIHVTTPDINLELPDITVEAPAVPVTVFNKTTEPEEMRDYAASLQPPQVNVNLDSVARMVGEVEARRILEAEKAEEAATRREDEARRRDEEATRRDEAAAKRHEKLIENLKPAAPVKITRRIERDANGLLSLIVDEPDEETG